MALISIDPSPLKSTILLDRGWGETSIGGKARKAPYYGDIYF